MADPEIQLLVSAQLISELVQRIPWVLLEKMFGYFNPVLGRNGQTQTLGYKLC